LTSVAGFALVFDAEDDNDRSVNAISERVAELSRRDQAFPLVKATVTVPSSCEERPRASLPPK